MRSFCFFALFGLLFLPFFTNAFVLFCPCMGRFGNQMEQFLGVFAFAKSLNRTLVLPPIVNYPLGHKAVEMIEFEQFFLIPPLAHFHRIVSLRHFVSEIAPKIWPTEKRKVLCWSPRPGLANRSHFGCHATEGNPFGPFWRYAQINFVGEEYFGKRTGGFDTEREPIRRKWDTEFPANSAPVLAFSSAPAAFPVRPVHRFLQHFVQWNEQIIQKANEFVSHKFGHGNSFVGIHLRNGRDWDNVCQFLREGKEPMDNRQIFASAQCTGPNEEFGPLTADACDPSMDIILEEIRSHVVRLSASAVFVASDRNHYLAQIGAHLAKNIRWSVTVAAWTTKADGRDGGGGNVPVELALLGMADHFIANCVSTFSAFVVRQRHFGNNQTQKKRSVSFFAFPNAAMELMVGERKNGNRKVETKNAEVHEL